MAILYGSLFQTRAATSGNARTPIMDRRATGTFRAADDADLVR